MTTFYVRRGRRYYPVRHWDPELDRAMPEGHHLVSVRPGRESRRYDVEPALAPMIAAGLVAEEAMVSGIVDAMALRPESQPLTDRQRELMAELTRSMNRSDLRWMRRTATDVARAGVQALQVEAEHRLSNPAVRQAYEHFLMVAELTRREKNNII